MQFWVVFSSVYSSYKFSSNYNGKQVFHWKVGTCNFLDVLQRVKQTFSFWLCSIVGHYYKCAGKKELGQFLAEPEKYVPPLAPRKLPPPSKLPRRRKPEEVSATAKIELGGYCPVTFFDGKCRLVSLGFFFSCIGSKTCPNHLCQTCKHYHTGIYCVCRKVPALTRQLSYW